MKLERVQQARPDFPSLPALTSPLLIVPLLYFPLLTFSFAAVIPGRNSGKTATRCELWKKILHLLSIHLSPPAAVAAAPFHHRGGGSRKKKKKPTLTLTRTNTLAAAIIINKYFLLARVTRLDCVASFSSRAPSPRPPLSEAAELL